METFWNLPNWEEHDKHLSKLNSLPFQRSFKELSGDNGLYIIRGPRQIGKTTWLKLLLKKYISKYGANQCCYLSLENIENRKELSELLKSLRKYKVVLLDEITYIKNWALSIKHEIDLGNFPFLIITGSNATDLRKGGEQLPGRFGDGGEFSLLPMSFTEFQQMREMAKWPKLSLKNELDLFFKVGGFPMALAESGPNGLIPKKSQEVYLKWLMGDILKLGKRETYFKEIMYQLALTTTSSISLQKLAQKTQMGSHHTALEYIELLEDCFALKTLYAINPDTSSFHFKKEKKFYFSDPIVFHIALKLGRIAFETKMYEQIAETVAHNEIVRKFSNKRIGYLSSSKGEIDFLCPNNFAIEIKWSEFPKNLSRAYLSHLSTWKEVWYQNNFLQVWPD